MRSSDGGGVYIWDGGGIDTFDASAEKQGVTVNLTPGSWNYSGTKSEHFIMNSYKHLDQASDYGIEYDSDFRTYADNYSYDFAQGQSFIGYNTQIENLIGSDYNDTLTGNDADNNISGGKGNDTIDGGKGNDYIDGGEGADNMSGGLGNDTFVVDNVGDKVMENANEGIDTVKSYIDYKLTTNVENLELLGNAVKGEGNELNNIITGNHLNNTLIGGAGDDRLAGGLGSDTLTGGEGKDTFVFDTALDGSIDTITDFKAGEDKIALARVIFTALPQDNSHLMDYIKYDQSTGALSYDPDANGIADAIHFANLQKDLQIDQTNFEIV